MKHILGWVGAIALFAMMMLTIGAAALLLSRKPASVPTGTLVPAPVVIVKTGVPNAEIEDTVRWAQNVQDAHTICTHLKAVDVRECTEIVANDFYFGPVPNPPRLTPDRKVFDDLQKFRAKREAQQSLP